MENFDEMSKKGSFGEKFVMFFFFFFFFLRKGVIGGEQNKKGSMGDWERDEGGGVNLG